MIFPVVTSGARAKRALELDVQVALRVDGFRWVRWLDGESPDPPRESAGRFLASPDDPLAHLQVPAPTSMAFAPQPYRHLPRYSRDPGLALAAGERAGLFRDGGASLGQDASGTWTLRLTDLDHPLRDACLPVLLARAALQWLARDRPSRKGLQ